MVFVSLLLTVIGNGQPKEILLWSGGVPGSEGKMEQKIVVRIAENGECFFTNVHKPSIAAHVPEAGKSTGTAIIIAPGSGHRELRIDNEGHLLAKRFQDKGIAAFVRLCGMDDYGNLTGWYSASVLGYSEADRASGYYEIGSPLFPKVTIAVDGPTPGIFIIQAHNVSNKNRYVQSATLNGKPLNAPPVPAKRYDTWRQSRF